MHGPKEQTQVNAGDRSAQKQPKVGGYVPGMCRAVDVIRAVKLQVLIFVMIVNFPHAKHGLNFFGVKHVSQY